MHYLIFTHAGLDALACSQGAAGATLHLNPDLLAAPALAALRAAGADVRPLPAAVDPRSVRQVREAAALAAQAGGGAPVWVEGAASALAPAVEATGAAAAAEAAMPAAEAVPAPAEPGGIREEPSTPTFHRRLARSAGQVLRRLGAHLSFGRALVLVPYFGYGNARQLSVRGRVLLDEGHREQSAADSRWSNLVELYKRLESDEVPGVRVHARFQDTEQEAVTDRNGYFSFDLRLPEPVGGGWHQVELDLPGRDTAARAAAEVLVPPQSARFGIISDIDDTVLWTNVTNKLNMLRMLAQANAHTRKPFKGVAAFYRALHEGAAGGENNPVFYVSSSPWHLFAPLADFLRAQGIPLGPLLLKELGMRQLFGADRHMGHKLERIESILAFYPHLQFVLIGDSGEQDPEIYAEVVRRHPHAVRAIYIRNVNPDPSRLEAIDRLVEEISASGTQLVLAPDSVAAATHAAGEGLIAASSLARVRADKRAEEASPPDGGPSDGGQAGG